MTNRKRVLVAIGHQQPDRCPYHISFTQAAKRKMAKFYGNPNFESSLGNCLAELSSAYDEAFEVEPDIWQDKFGVRWNRRVDKDIGVVCNQLVRPDNVFDYQFPDPDEPAVYDSFAEQLKNKSDTLRVLGLGFSLYERAWTLAGIENVLMAMVADKKFINALLDRILEFNLRLIDNFCRFDIDAIRFGDDWGQQTGLIMGANLWREIIKPRVRQMYAAVKARGKFLFIHSCGKVEEIFPDLIECGVDVFNPFQPEVMDVFEIKKKFGDRLSFFGGISTQRTLPFGTVKQTKDEVRRLIENIGKNGGYIASPAHAIPADAKAENIAAMIEVLQNQSD
jgi:uroporphyrinogen decarboxylase